MQSIEHGTATQLWRDLVRDGGQRQRVLLGEELEAYLVFALMRHQRDPELTARIMGEQWLKAFDAPASAERWQQVGDQCLLIAGLYPQLAHRRRVDQGYYAWLGRSAYASAADRARHGEHGLFAQLVEAFHSLVMVLRSLRQPAQAIPM